MKYRRFLYLAVIAALVVALPFAFRTAQAATITLPTAVQVASQINVGWNLGNTLEAQCGETAWGNPMVTQTFINSVKAAGFNAVRIPAAWDCHADQTTHTIDPTWMARVKTVVDYAISQNMYVILNIHWDDGWLENHVTFADQSAVNVKQNAYWTQIANTFINYDEHLLFAGTNEVHQDYNTPTSENITVQQSYNQTFVNAVRATGGNNATRTLVVQTYNTNIQHGLNFFSMPTDSASSRIIVEVHYYDPYDYTLNTSGPCLAWGAPYTQYSQCSWAQESYVDSTFAQVKTKWVAAGIPVIIGEYGVAKRSGLDLNSRQYWLKYINQAAKNNGIKTFYWDNGGSDMGIFDRNSGAVTDQGALTAILQGAGGGGPTNTPGPSITPSRTPTSGPTATRTNTPVVPTATRTNTPGGPTNTPVSGSLIVQINKGNGIDNTQETGFNFLLKNTGTSAVSNLSTRIYFDTDGSNAGSGYVLEKYYDQSGVATYSGPTLACGSTYYFTVTYGTASLPAGGQWEIQTALHLSSWASTYSGANDFYHGGYAVGALPVSYTTTANIPAYISGSLTSGSTPNCGGPTSTTAPTATRTPTQTVGASNTPIIPTITNSPVGPTATRTSTPIIDATPVRTNTPVGPTATRTNTPVGPTATRTPTQTVGASNTPVSGGTCTTITGGGSFAISTTATCFKYVNTTFSHGGMWTVMNGSSTAANTLSWFGGRSETVTSCINDSQVLSGNGAQLNNFTVAKDSTGAMYLTITGSAANTVSISIQNWQNGTGCSAAPTPRP